MRETEYVDNPASVTEPSSYQTPRAEEGEQGFQVNLPEPESAHQGPQAPAQIEEHDPDLEGRPSEPARPQVI